MSDVTALFTSKRWRHFDGIAELAGEGGCLDFA